MVQDGSAAGASLDLPIVFHVVGRALAALGQFVGGVHVVVDGVHLGVQPLVLPRHAVGRALELALALELVDDALELGVHGGIVACADAGLRGGDMQPVTGLEGCDVSGAASVRWSGLGEQALPALAAGGSHLVLIESLRCMELTAQGVGTGVARIGRAMRRAHLHGLHGGEVGQGFRPLWCARRLWRGRRGVRWKRPGHEEISADILELGRHGEGGIKGKEKNDGAHDAGWNAGKHLEGNGRVVGV